MQDPMLHMRFLPQGTVLTMHFCKHFSITLCPCPQVYITPLLGAYLADAVMGRFWVILVFSLIYFVVRGP